MSTILYIMNRLWRVDTYLPHVLETESDPIIDLGVLSQYLTGSRVGHNTWRYLLEDEICHGMAEESTKIDFIQAHLLRDLSESCCFIDRE